MKKRCERKQNIVQEIMYSKKLRRSNQKYREGGIGNNLDEAKK